MVYSFYIAKGCFMAKSVPGYCEELRHVNAEINHGNEHTLASYSNVTNYNPGLSLWVMGHKKARVLTFNPPVIKNICKKELRRYENVNKQQDTWYN
jgi:hypothetical protein